MARLDMYLVDRARILRATTKKVKGVVSKSDPIPVTDWIPARLRYDEGDENFSATNVNLQELFELVIHTEDESGDKVIPNEADTLEIRRYLDDKLTEVVVNYKIVGSIREIRKRSKLVSYVTNVRLDREY